MKTLKSVVLSAVAASTLCGGTVTVPASGWNLMGAMEPITTAQLFGDASKVLSVWKWDAYGKKWLAYSPNQATQNAISALTNTDGNAIPLANAISAGEGFWINVTNAGVTTYSPNTTPVVTAPTLNSSVQVGDFSINQNTYIENYPFNGYFLNTISGTTTYSTTFNIPGMTFYPATGVVTGAPNTQGSYSGTVTACNSTTACVTTSNFTITVNAQQQYNNYAPYFYNINYVENVPTLYVAKNTTLNIDLIKYAKDNEGGTISITQSGTSSLPSGLSFANGKIIGATSATTSGTLAVTLSDGTNSNSYNLNIVPIDESINTNGEPTFVYGGDAMSSVNLTNSMTFFEPDEDDEMPYLGVVTLSGENGTYGEYTINSDGTDLIAPANSDIESFPLSNKSQYSFNTTFDQGSETLTIISAKEVATIGGIQTTGLKEAVVQSTINIPVTLANATDWWESHYTNNDTSITNLATLKNAFIANAQYGQYVWINEDTRVTLAATSETATSGTAIGMVWDGTYWTNQCQYDDGCKRYISTGQSVGTWNLDSSYLTVTVPNKAIRAFKVEDNKLMETDIRAAGSTETWKWYFGPDFNTFKSVYLQVENASK